MAQEEPVGRAPITRCQHCPAIIQKRAGTTDWWESKDGSLICDKLYLDMRHKPMPRIPA